MVGTMCQCCRRPRQRRAFTILELIVTTSIFGMLIALLLPALMAARESARCLQCRSNLREIGLSIQQYHELKRRLPEAWTNASDKESGYGWAVDLLPFIEESALEKSVNRTLPVAALQNDVARNTDLPIMRCPSDISDPMIELYVEEPSPPDSHAPSAAANLPASDSTPLVRLPAANYVGVFGTLEADETFPAPAGDGSIVSNRVVRYSDLQRGQSHTLIVGERTMAMVPSTWFGVNFRGEDAACRLVGSAMTSPNCESCDECEFASRHSGGSNFVWADGHVTLVLNDIGSNEYQQLAKRHAD
jgi:prepilin-type processing-associated H-X9-DG protein